MSMSTNQAPAEVRPVELRHYAAALRARWYYPVLAALAGAAVALALSTATPDSYEATTTVLLRPLTADPLQQLEGGIDTATQRQIARSLEIAESALEELGTNDLTASEFLESSQVDAAPDADVLRFTIVDGDPEAAAARSNAFAAAYLRYRNRQGLDAIAAVRSNLQSRLETVLTERANVETALAELERDANDDGEPDGNPDEIGRVRSQLSVLDTRQALAQADIEGVSPSGVNGGAVLSPALEPSTPSGPGAPVLALTGLLVGAFIGAALALFRDSLDPMVTDGDVAQLLFGVPVIGLVKDPHPRLALRLRPHEAGPALARAAANLEAITASLSTVIVLPVGPSADSDVTATALADGLADRWDVVVMAEGAVTPAVPEFVFDQVNRRLAAKDLPDWVKVTPAGSADVVRGTIGSGGIPADPFALKELLTDRFDILVLRAPPLDADNLALRLGKEWGSMVLPVVRLGRTRRDELRQVRRDLSTAAITVPGLIVIGPRRAWGFNLSHGEPSASSPARQGSAAR